MMEVNSLLIQIMMMSQVTRDTSIGSTNKAPILAIILSNFVLFVQISIIMTFTMIFFSISKSKYNFIGELYSTDGVNKVSHLT